MRWRKIKEILLVLIVYFEFSSGTVSRNPGVGLLRPPDASERTPSRTTPARPCSRQTECAGIAATSCVRTHYDSSTRCLCGDNLPPVNGQCEASQTKALYHVCTTSDECNDGLVCATPNITATTPHLRVFNTDKIMICQCDTENGYLEKEFACSDADITKISLFAFLIAFCMRKYLSN